MATTTYKKTTNPTAIFGEESPAVLALQKELNAKGAGLKEDAKYGPLTQAAFTKFQNQTTTPPPAPTPTPTPTPTPVDTTRYKRTANVNDTGIKNLESEIATAYGTEKPDLAKITEEKRKQSEALVDSIRAEFARVFAGQEGENAKMNDRVRALNVSAGLGGSDFATANAVEQERKGKKALDLINAERDAKIQAVYAGIDSRASEEYKTRRQDYIKGLETNLAAKKAARDEDRKQAENSVRGFAQAGIDVTKLKTTDPDTFNQLLQEYGGSELDLETAWNAALPENMKVQYEQKTLRGGNGNAVILRYGFNPVTGKTESKEYDTGIAYSKLAEKEKAELREVDGRLWAITKDEKGNLKAEPLTQKADSDSENKLSTASRTKLLGAGLAGDDISSLEKDINQYGFETIINRSNSGLSDGQKKALREAYGVSEKITRTKLESQITQKMAIEGDGTSENPGLRGTYTDKELKELADEKGYSSFFTGKDSDVERFLNSTDAKKLYIDLLYEQYKTAGMAE